MNAFAELISRLDPAMAIVTTAAGDERAGCLIGFHAQCSIEPERYVVWLSKANHTCRVALHADCLAVHFLGQDQLELARLFGTTTGDEIDKFSRCEWQPDASSVPLLTACPDRIVGRRVALLDEGSDHVCIVIEPTEVQSSGHLTPMRLSQASVLDAAHDAPERPEPADLRAD